MMGSLRQVPFQISYGPGDDRLHRFYIPALQASVRYDRMAGFFASSALAVAAAGVAHLIANGGTMRLLVGAQLSSQDVEAIRAGHEIQAIVAARLGSALPDPQAIADRLLRDRLAALAWMVAAGSLEVRVVLPRGPDGLPLPAPASQEYFHPKVGIFVDAHGDQVAFSGSVNESETAWQHNYEQFFVFPGWTEARAYVAEAVGRFERLWAHQEPDWIAMPIPEAARQKLIRYAPASAPTRDPLERTAGLVGERAVQMALAPARLRERVLLQFLRDAPHLAGASGLGIATCALTPWPHQRVVARRLVADYPGRYLLADEVGLGKTIEAGLALRQLWLSGVVRRALILAPRSLLRQWQEELYEKCALDVPIYDGKVFRDLWERESVPCTPNAWDGAGLVLASSQLVKRRERREALLDARPWDLVIVDEAHHARRRDFLDPQAYRPNRLLELLNELRQRTQGLILATATPMQVHPIEVWDLLSLLGLSGEWGVDGRLFLAFYGELRRPVGEADWSFVFRLLRAELAARRHGGTASVTCSATGAGPAALDPRFEELAMRELGAVDWQRVRALISDPDPGRALGRLPPQARPTAVAMVREHTPLRRLIFRHTRPLLRAYARQGLLQDNVPLRDPRLEWIPMRPAERALYERIEEYIAHFYHQYEQERKGLGFVMTVYRRRLTSSFYAVRCSLQRRLDYLRGRAGWGLDEDDVEQEALSLDVDEAELDDRATFQDEIAYVEDFIHALGALSDTDSKVERLLGDLRAVFGQRDTVLVFTQYTDTMDFLRDQLRQSYGQQVACYSGRGGERWDGVLWAPVTKEEVKIAFRQGQEVKILLCTDAASEGLNLQTCGVLINYDMPWNPMRVEQRIGRVDRIGQRYGEVWIRNYFYEDTVEARVYRALAQRIDWFQDVVGPLQPILARVGQAIQALAMVPEAERQRALREELAELCASLDGAQAGLNLDEWAGQVREEDAAALATLSADVPVTLPELAQVLTTTPALQECFCPHERIPNAFWLRLDEREAAVTFDPQAFDEHPNTLHLLTFGSPLLETILDRALDGAPGETGPLLRVSVEAPLPRVAYYALDASGHPRRLARLADVRAALEASSHCGAWPAAAVAMARADLQGAVQAEWKAMEDARSRLEQAQRSAQVARAACLLLQAALVELALGQRPDMFAQEAYPLAFDRAAVVGLKRHGYPWTPLLRIAGGHLLEPRPTDPFFVEIQGEPADRLRRRLETLRQRAERLVQAFAGHGHS